MKLVRVAAAVLNQTPMAWESNKAHILAAIAEARRQRASILCLPEMCISGYGCEDAFHSPGLSRTARQLLEEVVPATQGLVVSFGLPVAYQNALYNAACLAADGKIVGFVAKQFLAGDGLHYEPRWFKPWPNNRQGELRWDQHSYPIGDLFFDVGGVKIGFEICEDAWVANRPGSALALSGVDVILNPSASHFAFGKIRVRERFVIEGSRAFSVSYVYANLLGNEAGRSIYDGGALVASAGRLLASGPRFSYADMQVTTATVDIDQTRMVQARTGSYQPVMDAEHSNCVRVDFSYPEVEPELCEPTPAAWEYSPHIKEEEFARAMSLALFDYLRKSRSNGFVVSLSGGADSSTITSLVGSMVEFGVGELGRDGFIGKLNYIPGLADAAQTQADARELTRRLLSCVYQSTRNSGEVTRTAARQVAEAVGATYYEFDVDAVVQEYIGMVQKAIGRPLDWKADDVALQNIQARSRSPSVWLLANLQGSLLLSTSNRSEAAVGYATMDGDTSGGLSPIAGIDKAFLRRWLVWRETSGPQGLSPMPALAAVNVQAPTAELRPPTAKQTDEEDLMPYPVLDAIERAAIRDKQTPVEIYRTLRLRFAEYDAPRLAFWIERFFKLFCRNQWKRERYAPSFHVDDENLDPKTWCRFPILSGGYERELAELRAFVEREEKGQE